MPSNKVSSTLIRLGGYLTLFFLLLLIALGIMIYFSTEKDDKKEIQGFYISSDTNDYTNFRYDILTTIVYAKVNINADGSLTPSSNYNPSPLISYAHDRKVKVVLMFQGRDDISKDTILVNQTIGTIAINNLLNEIKKYDFDGIDIDLESLNIKNSINGQSNKQLMTDFVASLSDKFQEVDTNYRISIDIGMDYQDVDKIFDLHVIQNKVNYIMMMGYDQYGSWSSTAGPNSPISLDNGRGINDSIKHYKGLIDKNKFLLGVPFYGYEFATVNDNRLASVNGDVNYISYKDYVNITNKYTRKWDSVWQTPWYTYQDNITSQWYQVHYDDIQSLGIKYNIVNSEGIAGIGIWAINYGIDRPELWQLIQDKFRFRLSPR